MKDNSKNEIPPIDMGGEKDIDRIERNNWNYFHTLDERLVSIERTLNKFSHHVASLEDALAHITRIPDLPLELEYDHRTNTLWTETRRKLEFTKKRGDINVYTFH